MTDKDLKKKLEEKYPYVASFFKNCGCKERKEKIVKTVDGFKSIIKNLFRTVNN